MEPVQKAGKYLLIGDLCMDVFMQVNEYPLEGGDGSVQRIHQHAGGSAANTAMALANLGGKPALLTHTGSDIWSQQLLPILESAGVNTDRIVREEHEPTGLTFLVVSKAAERTMFTYRGANSCLHPDEITSDLLTGVEMLHISAYACLKAPQSESVLKAVDIATQQQVGISLDVGVEPAHQVRELLLQLLPKLSLIILGEGEARVITDSDSLEEAIATLLNAGVQMIGLKSGKDGCRLVTKEQDLLIPGFVVNAIDTTGAGDSFCAGIIHGLTHAWDLAMTGRLANAMGALATTRWGAGEMLPTLKEICAFLSERNSWMSDPVILQILEQLDVSNENRQGQNE
ncbi:MAG: carbohydrate kinase family protein [Anaerolineaceae bacterium]|nr:carbohydrate kinase family protein [Anaerolineaceae bacterium]